jgi:hypothetical protein
MKNWLNGIAAKATSYVSSMRSNERGDIVQTLMIIAVAVILIAVVYGALSGAVDNCIGPNGDFTGDCFGVG